MPRTLRELTTKTAGPTEVIRELETLGGYHDALFTIRAVAQLERALRELIASRLASKDRPTDYKLERAPLADLIKIISRNSLVGRQTIADLETLKDLRNAFAHSLTDLSFDTPEIGALVDVLGPLPSFPPSRWLVGLPPRRLRTRRERFADYFFHLHARLGWAAAPDNLRDGDPILKVLD